MRDVVLLSSATHRPPPPAGHVDPSGISLREIAKIRGAMWTVRGPWHYGPRPLQPDNITALEYIYSYGDPYVPTALGGAFNLNDEQQAMLATYKGEGYTHACTGPVTAQSYRQHWPDYFFNSPTTFDHYLDWLQMFWDHGLCPIVFLHPDNWSFEDTVALYDPLIRGNARAQRLMRCIVPGGWEPTRYDWSSHTWRNYMTWAHDLLPNALILLHTVSDVDAPAGTDELYDDNGLGNDQAWWNVAPHIHGWLTQSSAFEHPDVHDDPNHPEKTSYDNWADTFSPVCYYSYWCRFHEGYAGWPTVSLWGNEPIYLYAGEFCSYWNYHDNRPYAEGVGWGDRAIDAGADGALDSCHCAPPGR